MCFIQSLVLLIIFLIFENFMHVCNKILVYLAILLLLQLLPTQYNPCGCEYVIIHKIHLMLLICVYVKDDIIRIYIRNIRNLSVATTPKQNNYSLSFNNTQLPIAPSKEQRQETDSFMYAGIISGLFYVGYVTIANKFMRQHRQFQSALSNPVSLLLFLPLL